jgi:hypothetical protein
LKKFPISIEAAQELAADYPENAYLTVKVNANIWSEIPNIESK